MRRIALLIVATLAGGGLLLGLGVWQLERLAWKEGLIAEIEARLAAEPVVLPATPDAERDRFLRVRVEGRIGEGMLRVLTPLAGRGAGFRVIVPVETGTGRRILVDLGIIPEALKDGLDLPGRRVSLTGALHWPDEVDRFTPPPDRARGIWFARDLDAMAQALGTEPVLVVADAHDLGPWPEPRRVGTGLRNDHLGYAITWFSLALALEVIGVMLILRELRRRAGG